MRPDYVSCHRDFPKPVRVQTEKPIFMSALGQSSIVRDASGVQMTTWKPPTKKIQRHRRQSGDMFHECDCNSFSFTYRSSSRLEPKVTREQLTTCRKRISRDAENNWMAHRV